MTAYFTCGVDRAELKFSDDAAAVAFAHRLARKMCFCGFDVGAVLQVADDDGKVIARIRLKRPLH